MWREERVAATALADAALLRAAGFGVRWLRQTPLVYAAEVNGAGGTTRLEWAAGGRREVRDLVDLITIHRKILPLGAVIWAAVEKAPGFTPEGLIAEIRRNSHYPAAEWRSLAADAPLDPTAISAELRAALDEAEAFVPPMPTGEAGPFSLDGMEVVQPDPVRLSRYQTHEGRAPRALAGRHGDRVASRG